ncbi:MAG: acetyltransferase [Chloroflexota bacterium]
MLYTFPYFPDTLENDHAPKMLGERPTVHPTVRLKQCVLGSWSDIGPNSVLIESCLGDYTYLAGDVSIVYADVGKFCSIASHVRINPGNHPMQRVMQHHCTYRRVQYGFDDHDDEEFFDWRREHRCVVGHDVWLGHGAIVMPGVKIGNGAVIGSGAVVTHDIAPYEIAVGVPAKPIRTRFTPEVIAALEQIAWWDWDRATLEARFHDFFEINSFMEKYRRHGTP